MSFEAGFFDLWHHVSSLSEVNYKLVKVFYLVFVFWYSHVCTVASAVLLDDMKEIILVWKPAITKVYQGKKLAGLFLGLFPV